MIGASLENPCVLQEQIGQGSMGSVSREFDSSSNGQWRSKS
jgi:hypothetical protein